MSGRSSSGAALLVVLLATGLLSSLLYALVESQHFWIKKTANELNLQQAKMNAFMALDQVLLILDADTETGETDHLLEPWANLPPLPMPNGTVVVHLQDVESKWNLNALLNAQGQLDPDFYNLVQRLFQSNELDQQLLDSLLDWIDSNDLPTGIGGAERFTYQALEKPYLPRNSPMQSLSEIGLVHHWDNDAYNKIEPLLTAAVDCGRQLNVNTAENEVLLTISEGMTQSLLETINEIREDQPFESINEFIQLPVLSGVTLPTQMLAVRSQCFLFTAVSDVGGVRGRMTALLNRSQGQSKVAYQFWEG